MKQEKEKNNRAGAGGESRAEGGRDVGLTVEAQHRICLSACLPASCRCTPLGGHIGLIFYCCSPRPGPEWAHGLPATLLCDSWIRLGKQETRMRWIQRRRTACEILGWEATFTQDCHQGLAGRRLLGRDLKAAREPAMGTAWQRVPGRGKLSAKAPGQDGAEEPKAQERACRAQGIGTRTSQSKGSA